MTWKPLWISTAVTDAVHLADLIGPLAPGQFGIAKASEAAGRRWGQVMNVADSDEPWACIVEVHDGSPTDFAKRVFRGTSWSDYPPNPGRQSPHGFELFTAPGAASIVWDWLHVGLPNGLLRTHRYLDPAQRRRHRLA